jgi:hypothetical protein
MSVKVIEVQRILNTIDNPDELRMVSDILRDRFRTVHTIKDLQSKGKWTVNDDASYKGKYGVQHNCKIVKINRTTATVRNTFGELWRIPLGNLLPPMPKND